MYMTWVAPIGAGGQSEPFVPRITSDAAGNPLPLQSEVPTSGGRVVADLAIGVTGAQSIAGPTAGSPLVFPWMNYGMPLSEPGGLSSSGVPVLGPNKRIAAYIGGAFSGDGGAFSDEPPWSDALEGNPPCCGGSRSLWDILRAHPWVTLGVAAALVLVVQRRGDNS